MTEITVIHLKSFLQKSIGLIGKQNVSPVMFKTRFGIHTFGMRVPIDVLVLDKNYKVVKLTKALKSNKIFFWNPVYDTILELPEGEIEKKKIKVGETIKIEIIN